MTTTTPIIYNFRNDLRLSDNRGLTAAIATGQPLIACYIFDENSYIDRGMGSASAWWLHHSLTSLAESLKQLGLTLILRRGDWQTELLKLCDETNAKSVFWPRAYEPNAVNAEQQLHFALKDKGIVHKRFSGFLLYEPESVRTLNDQPFKVFTPFWKACLKKPVSLTTLPTPKTINPFKEKVRSENLDDWSLLPTNPNWASGFEMYWSPGEDGAWEKLKAFTDVVSNYPDGRDIPGIDGTSKLSAHLHFGEISPTQIWQHLELHCTEDETQSVGKQAYVRELGWREFSYHLLSHWPTIIGQPFREKFKDFKWKKNKKALIAWQKGNTGIPLIDAGMRELWHTGWMHNRVRMVVGSFLVKNCLIHWQQGERWFWDTLVDADIANNVASWQWVAGSGADAAPYFRIFNPVTQSQKFDPDGAYIRRWIPELSHLPSKYIHAPWEAPAEILKQAGIQIGKDYPKPIVDLKISRQQALESYALLRNQA